ncbi:MAG: 30S ribosomal protein S1 [Bacillaceae bacterium]|nr:30S ribosomal protein S1 [Bacillaceae bacterium]
MTEAMQTNERIEKSRWDYLNFCFSKQEVIAGTVCSIHRGIEGDDEQEYALIDLDGIQGICKAKDFDFHQFRSLAGFVGHRVQVVITSLSSSVDGVVEVNRVKALHKLQENFWRCARVGQVVTGRISGWNERSKNLFVLIDGVTAFLHIRDWSYEYKELKDVSRLGKEVRVKIVELDPSQSRVRVSRRAVLQDPWPEAEKIYKPDDLHLGEVTTVHPKHGVFVKLGEGLEILCNVARRLPEPVAGMKVTVKIMRMDAERRKGRGIIVHYPHGREES